MKWDDACETGSEHTIGTEKMKTITSTPFHTLKDSKKNLTLKKQHENVPKSPL